MTVPACDRRHRPRVTRVADSTMTAALEDFEKDLHQHTQPEDNALFPRAAELEAARAE